MNSTEIEKNLLTLDENCKKLIELINKCHVKLEHFAHLSKENNGNTGAGGGGGDKADTLTRSSSNPSSPTSSILLQNSSSMELAKYSAEDLQLKNVIVSNLVSYSYEIAHTVKRIVCIMGHSENTNL